MLMFVIATVIWNKIINCIVNVLTQRGSISPTKLYFGIGSNSINYTDHRYKYIYIYVSPVSNWYTCCVPWHKVYIGRKIFNRKGNLLNNLFKLFYKWKLNDIECFFTEDYFTVGILAWLYKKSLNYLWSFIHQWHSTILFLPTTIKSIISWRIFIIRITIHIQLTTN